ncbi:hypothetical protein [Pedobacter steynii]|nr:hypothetical protein [Pedobacter steynii]
MESMEMILVTPSAAPGEYYFLAFKELIPIQLLGNPEKGIPGEYNRAYDRDFEYEVIKTYAQVITRSKIPVVEDYDRYIMTTISDTWYIAKIDMKK